MTITERLQGAGLSCLFVVLCVVVGRSMIRETRAGTAATAGQSVMARPGNIDQAMPATGSLRPGSVSSVGASVKFDDTPPTQRD